MRWAILCFVLAIVAGLFGYGVVGPPRDGAQIGSVLLAALAIMLLTRSLMSRHNTVARPAASERRDQSAYSRRTTPKT